MAKVDSGAIVSKGDFAALCKVSPGRVSQWIAQRKLSGDALVGEGRNARINVEVAQQQLRLRLDASQSLGNGLSTQLSVPSSASATQQVQQNAPAFAVSGDEAITDRLDAKLKQEKLDQLRRANRKAADEEAARAGLYILAADARREMSTIAEQMMRIFEGSLTDFATAVAAAFQVPQRDALHALRDAFRKVRATAAAAATARAAGHPERFQTD